MNEVAAIKVFRFDPDKDKEPYFDSFNVRVRKGMTVLEALFDILENQDGSLGLRYSCRGAVCGSCAMHINGYYRLACQTQIENLKGNEVLIRPLGHLPVIKDLIVDMRPFFEKYESIMPYLITQNGHSETGEQFQSQKARAKIDEMIDCILCGCCHASCTMTLTDKDYLGPATLLKANRFYIDSRDKGGIERLKLVDGEHGVWRCHTIFNCNEVCPKYINPTRSIARLKRGLIKNKILGRI
jgi:succinate dehydrogenase / fumarate reductase iron-sulfur subunit